jgi:hypothetical protein
MITVASCLPEADPLAEELATFEVKKPTIDDVDLAV